MFSFGARWDSWLVSETGSTQAEPESAMEVRVRVSFERQAMIGTLGVQLTAVGRGRSSSPSPMTTGSPGSTHSCAPVPCDGLG
jgi:hypothetical protein